MDKKELSIPRAIKKLFFIELSQYKGFKDRVYPLVKNKNQDFIAARRKRMSSGSRDELFISVDSLDKLHNAVILQGFFADTKRVKSLFSDKKKRAEATEFLSTIFAVHKSVYDEVLQAKELTRLIDIMHSETPLDSIRLPNPFIELPQLSINGLTTVMQALLAKSAVLSHGEVMMMHYINGDLAQAYEEACKTKSESAVVMKYRSLIMHRYQEAKDFDNLLDDLLN